MKTRIFLTLAASLVLAGCATAPKPLQGQFSTVSPRDSVAQKQTGTPVRWGGRIIETLPGQGETCFQMIARPLNGSGRPSSTSLTPATAVLSPAVRASMIRRCSSRAAT